MEIKCNKCGKTYKDIFDTVIHLDYLESGKGKPYKWHLCIECRKKIINWFENRNS